LKPADDTIAAIATATGGGIGILRVSGPHSHSIAHALLGHAPIPRHAHYAIFRDATGRVLDRGLLLAFRAPHSFTGEDVLELHAHGNPLVLETLLARVCELAARRARAGEFSERAFLNGKLDLTQAEATADLIAAGSEAQARAALRSLEGVFAREVEALLHLLTQLRAYVEAAIDFTDEEIDFLAEPALATQLVRVRAELASLMIAARRGRQLRDGLYVVISGAPNVGKSSLLNALARSERAIVTATPGTTRDVLREKVTLGGARIELIDTAGLRDTHDPVEAEGVRRANVERARADLVIEVVEAVRGDARVNAASTFPVRGSGFENHTVMSRRIVVHNKSDLAHIEAHVEMQEGDPHVWLSARESRGVDLLEALLAQAAGGGESTEGAFSARARHVDALARTQSHLDAAAAQLGAGAGELAAEELRQAQNSLGEITGAFTPDDLLGRIFATFCIGK